MKKTKIIYFCFLLCLFTSIKIFATEHMTINYELGFLSSEIKNYSQIGSGGAFYITSSGKVTLGPNMNVSTNSATRGGGAIYNNGILNINSSMFSFNVAKGSDGGVIKNVNDGVITISSAIFTENSAGEVGGAIFNNKGTITISSSSFSKNKAESNTGRCSGGAIDIDVNGIITIKDYSSFSENRAKLGGAIENNGMATIISTVFSGNIATEIGGAIDNSNRLTISSCVFTGNIANIGGAIENKDENMGVILISSSIFNSNTATNIGGAIHNNKDLTVTIQDGTSFINNAAYSYGGAIYNEGTINLIANTADIVFTGNTAFLGISNAIHDNDGIINLWTSENADIIFNDRISSENSSSILNINSSTTTLNAIGKIILNEYMGGYTGTVNLYDGEIELQAKADVNDINLFSFFSGDINLSSGTLNILNNTIDLIDIDKLTTTENANLKIDANLTDNVCDNFTIRNNVSGVLNLTAINILGVGEDNGQITLFNNEISPEINILTKGFYGMYEYTFENSEIAGILNYQKTGRAKTLKEVINETEPINRSCSLEENEFLIEDVGDLGGEQLTIFGNGYDIRSSDSCEGIYVANDKILNIENVNNWCDFNNVYGAIKNDGTLKISGTNFNNNGQDIINNGNLLLYGDGSSFEKGIVGVGTTTIRDTNINLSNGMTEQGRLLIYGNSKITNDGKLVVGKGTNYGTIEQTTNTSTMTITGNFINGGTIKQNKLNIEQNGELQTAPDSIIGNIENNGTILFWDGANNNKITGIGTLYIGEAYDYFINNNLIEQTLVTIEGYCFVPRPPISKAVVNPDDPIPDEQQIIMEKFINNSSIYTENLNLKFANFKLTENGSLFVENLVSESSNMDFANSVLQEHNFKTINLIDDLNLSVDADLENKKMDTLSTENFEGEGKINIKAINILTDAKENKTEISFTTSTVLKDKITSITNVSSKLFKYDVDYDKNTGNYNFLLTANTNPIIVESQVARASGLITQATVLNQAFSSIDNIRDRIIQAKQKGLLYASTTDMLFDNPNRIESGLWIRPFIAQDSISFDSLDVDNTLTGTLAGIDLATGENSLVSFYLGYAGSNQKYENIKVNQAAYLLGATGMFIKDKWYAGITANINFNKAESESDYGTDSFDLNMYSVGAKAGYNFDLSDKFILEPNLTLMYGNVSNQEYETTQGAKIDSQSTANIVLEPQVKAKLDLSNGWQPYGLLGYLLNAGEKAKLVVDNVAFEDMGISGYVEYGLGLNKTFKNSAWSCYLQATGRSGDINGFNGNLGIKYSFLNKKEKEDIKSIKDTKKKEQEKIKEEQAKQKLIEEERIRKEKEEKAKLEAEEKARLAEENRIKKEEQAKQKALEKEKIRKEREEKERQRQLEIERKLNEYYN